MGAGRGGCGGDADSRLGGGSDGGVGGDGRDRDNGRLIQYENNLANLTLVTEPNYPLAYASGLEHHHPIMSTIGSLEAG